MRWGSYVATREYLHVNLSGNLPKEISEEKGIITINCRDFIVHSVVVRNV